MIFTYVYLFKELPTGAGGGEFWGGDVPRGPQDPGTLSLC